VAHLRLAALYFAGASLLEALGCALVCLQLGHFRVLVDVQNVAIGNVFQYTTKPAKTPPIQRFIALLFSAFANFAPALVQCIASLPVLSLKMATQPQVAQTHLVQIDLTPRKPAPKPAWLRARAPMGETFHALKSLARELNLHTVCESAQCPNIGECWNQRTATFMMLGNLCTRRCGFCAVPKGAPLPIDHDEPRRVADAVARLGLRHAVITSVNRDDDNLGAARTFADVIAEIRLATNNECRVEVLTPDFQGNEDAIRIVVDARPEILNHNIETVPRLYRVAKSGGRYERSLRFLEFAKELRPDGVTKTGIIIGMGEETHELLAVFRDLADRKVDILTIGQYLRPSRDHIPMARYYTPDEFADLKREALAMGFRHVESGPLVRSSYHAHEQAQSTGLA
jgi:lipoic acid synthetase